jgi:hypothetical protein
VRGLGSELHISQFRDLRVAVELGGERARLFSWMLDECTDTDRGRRQLDGSCAPAYRGDVGREKRRRTRKRAVNNTVGGARRLDAFERRGANRRHNGSALTPRARDRGATALPDASRVARRRASSVRLWSPALPPTSATTTSSARCCAVTVAMSAAIAPTPPPSVRSSTNTQFLYTDGPPQS